MQEIDQKMLFWEMRSDDFQKVPRNSSIYQARVQIKFKSPTYHLFKTLILVLIF